MNVLKFKFFLIILTYLLLVSNEKLWSQEAPPNIIYILADDIGYGDVQAFNPEGKIPTPNINSLAESGIKFTDAHTSSSVCTPTRYGILTGRYNWRSPLKSGVLTGASKPLIPNHRTTVANLLKANGYNTAFIGKWHLGWDWQLKDKDSALGNGWNSEDFANVDFSKPIKNSPNDLGFDYTYASPASLDMPPYVYVENDKVIEQPNKFTEGMDGYGWWRNGPTSPHFVHQDVTPHFFDKSFEYIRAKADNKNPFFMYLALPSPHAPILPGKEWQGKSNLNTYGDFVMEIDSLVGDLIALLGELGLSKNTMVIFTGDNGCAPSANFEVLKENGHNPSANFRGHKADIYEGGHREPFIVKWPEKIMAGTQSSETICTTDLLSTCADLLNVDLEDNEGEDSFSILPLLLNPDSENYKRKYTVHHSVNGSFAIRKDEWKMIFCPGSGGWSDPRPNSKVINSLPKFQLYNLIEDSGESNNLYDKNPQIANELRDLMKKIIEDGRSTEGARQQNDSPFNEEQWQEIENIFNKS